MAGGCRRCINLIAGARSPPSTRYRDKAVIWHLCKGWAALLSERYQEAVEFTTEAVEANPEFPDVYAVLAAAHGHLGNAAAASESLAEFLRRTPALTAADERLNRPFECRRLAGSTRTLSGRPALRGSISRIFE